MGKRGGRKGERGGRGALKGAQGGEGESVTGPGFNTKDERLYRL